MEIIKSMEDDPKFRPSGVIVTENFVYSKEDVTARLEEIYKVSLKFVTTKERAVIIIILTELIKDEFFAGFQVEKWRDFSQEGTRFRDLIELSLMYKIAKKFMKIENQETVTFEMGASLMQDIANTTIKLYKHRYES